MRIRMAGSGIGGYEYFIPCLTEDAESVQERDQEQGTDDEGGDIEQELDEIEQRLQELRDRIDTLSSEVDR